MRGMWSNSEEILVKEVVANDKKVTAFIAQFNQRGRSGSIPLMLDNGRVLRKYWVARCVVEIPTLGIQFDSFGNSGVATKKEAIALAKSMAESVA